MEQKNFGGKNYQIQSENIGQIGDVYNIESLSQPTGKELLHNGIQLINHKAYQQAIDVLNSAIKTEPSLSATYYYLAIALLKGKRPKVLKCIEIEEIDRLLDIATIRGDSDGTIQLFRALVRDDYYNGNRLNCPPPSVADILSSISSTIDISRLRMLLTRLPMPDNQLYNVLAQQIL